MKNISLLPPEIAQNNKKQENQRYIYYSVGGLAVLLLIVFITLLSVTLNNKFRADSTMEQRLAMENQIDELQFYEDMQKAVVESEEMLISALGSSPHWYSIIRNLSLSFSSDIWLSDVAAAFEEEPGEMIVRGRAQSYDSIAKWLEKAKEIKGLKDLRLRNTQEQSSAAGPIIAFEALIHIEKGEPFKLLREGGE